MHSALRVFAAAMAIALDLLLLQPAVAQQPPMAQQPAAPQPAAVQQPEPANPPAFKPEQLDQLLAPIALYPDELIAQT